MNYSTIKHSCRLCLTIVLLVFFSQSVQAQWTLVWQDEFNGSIGPDWVYETGTGSGGWGNNELQYYRQQNATVNNGHLVITARNQNFGGMNYTSARMKTQGKKSWKYGRIEARISMPSFSGVWPAFWMLGDNISSVGWPSCGEIDIMEHINTEQSTHGTIHWQDHNGNYANYGGSTGVNITQFHVYAIEWNDQSIKWFLDGNQYHEVNIAGGINGTSEFHNNFFIILNMAIGGNWPGFNINNSAMPAEMRVDYVRVYSGSGGGGGFSQTIQAENYAVMSGVQTENCSEGGLNVGWIDANDWMVWDVNLPSSGSYNVEYRVASLNGGGSLQLEKAGGSPVYGSRSVPYTGGWQNWTTVSHTVNLSAGQQQIAIKALSGGWNLNWLKISSASGSRTGDTGEVVTLEQPEISLYPNPVHTTLKLQGLDRGGHFMIFNLGGQLVMNGMLEVHENQSEITVDELTNGTYIIKLSDTEKSFRFIKQ